MPTDPPATAATVTLDREVYVGLVRYIDRSHESDSGWCHPRVPDDCSTYCRACEALRPVADDLLIEARKGVER